MTTGQWDMLPEMNEARRALAAVALPDGIYAIGGYDGKSYLASVERYSYFIIIALGSICTHRSGSRSSQ